MYQNQMFSSYPQNYAQPYHDRLAQIQAQYQQTIPQGVGSLNQGLLWVQGDAGAKAYMMAPNTTVLLMDSEGQKFYLKSTDATGVPSLRTFEYTEILNNSSQALQREVNNLDDKYVTRKEYDGIQAKFKEILDRLETMNIPDLTSKKKTQMKEVNVDE